MITAAVLAVVAVVAVPLLWDRAAWTRTVRSASVLVAVLLVVLAVGGFVNAQAGFFPTWSSLFGDSSAGLAVGHGGVDADLSGVSGRGATDRALAGVARQTRGGHGAIVRLQFGGERSGIDRVGAVYLPAAYFARDWRTFRFPVIEVLSGSPGNPAAELKYLEISRFLDAEIAARRMAPTVAVIPTTNPSVLHDAECADAVGGEQDDTYLTADLRADMVHDFRVREDRLGWAVMGNSTGGYCAVNLALRHPQWYGAGVSLSGYFRALTDVTTGDLYRGRPDVRDANDPTWMIEHWPTPPVALYLVAGNREAEGPEMLAFAALIHPPASVTTVLTAGTGHSFGAWRNDMPGALDWLGTVMAGPEAAPGPPSAGAVVRVRAGVVAPPLPAVPHSSTHIG